MKDVKKAESHDETSGVMLRNRHGKLIEGTNRETFERQNFMTCCLREILKKATRQTHAVTQR